MLMIEKQDQRVITVSLPRPYVRNGTESRLKLDDIDGLWGLTM